MRKLNQIVFGKYLTGEGGEYPMKKFCSQDKEGKAPGGGEHFHISLYGTCRFSGYHFSAKIPERGLKIDQKFRNGL